VKKIKAIRVMVMAMVLSVVMAAVAFAGPQDFTLVNQTGYTIHVVNISPASENNWQEDVLGSQLLANGESLDVAFDTGNIQNWDIRVIFEDGSGLAFSNIDLLSYAVVTLNGNGQAVCE